MTIEEMQAAKRQAEAAIRQAVQKFMTDTGLQVTNVRVGFVDAYGCDARSPVCLVSSVTMDVKL